MRLTAEHERAAPVLTCEERSTTGKATHAAAPRFGRMAVRWMRACACTRGDIGIAGFAAAYTGRNERDHAARRTAITTVPVEAGG